MTPSRPFQYYTQGFPAAYHAVRIDRQQSNLGICTDKIMDAKHYRYTTTVTLLKAMMTAYGYMGK